MPLKHSTTEPDKPAIDMINEIIEATSLNPLVTNQWEDAFLWNLTFKVRYGFVDPLDIESLEGLYQRVMINKGIPIKIRNVYEA